MAKKYRYRVKVPNLILLIIILAVIPLVIIGTCTRESSRPEEESQHAGRPETAWSDTLTNAASDLGVFKPVDADIERFRQRWDVTGMSIAVTRGDSLLFAKGYGWADKEAGVPMDASTIMRIASASKLITAAAVMKLAEQKKISLDSKVFGPDGILNDTELTAAIKDPRILEITVDHLLQHRGGFTLGAGDPMFNTAEIMKAKRLSKAPDNRELTKIVLGRRLGFQPGASRRYSNFGYMLLSLLIEQVTGKSYWDYVNSEILYPAGAYMFVPASNSYAERQSGEARYYGPDTEKVPEYNNSGRMVDRVYGGSNVKGLMGAGGWVTSAAGLARFVAAIDGHPGVKDIISPASIGLMTMHVEEEKQTRGWTDSDAHGRWLRTGTLSSTHTHVVRFPEGDCWVIVTNSGNWKGFRFTPQLQRLVDNLRAKYLGTFPRRDLW